MRSKHHIQIPKRYTSNAIWEPQQYRLTQSLEPLDLNKGTSPSAHCWSFLPGLRLSEQSLRECSESKEPASAGGWQGQLSQTVCQPLDPYELAYDTCPSTWPVANLEKLHVAQEHEVWGSMWGTRGLEPVFQREPHGMKKASGSDSGQQSVAQLCPSWVSAH